MPVINLWKHILVSIKKTLNQSGLPMYQAGAGLKDIGLMVALQYKINSSWGLLGIMKYTKLLGDAMDSPIVESAVIAIILWTVLLLIIVFKHGYNDQLLPLFQAKTPCLSIFGVLLTQIIFHNRDLLDPVLVQFKTFYNYLKSFQTSGKSSVPGWRNLVDARDLKSLGA